MPIGYRYGATCQLTLMAKLLHQGFLLHDAKHSADYAVTRCPSVRPSVCLSHARILSKRLNISSNFFTIG